METWKSKLGRYLLSFLLLVQPVISDPSTTNKVDELTAQVKMMKEQLNLNVEHTKHLTTLLNKLVSALIVGDEDRMKVASLINKKQKGLKSTADISDLVISGLTLQDLKALLRGIDGRDGMPGATGTPGPPEERGTAGVSGSQGEPGSAGSIGLPGVPGPPGSQGVTGRPGLPGDRGPHGLSGSVYTRWGRKSCPGNSTLIYQGFAAGGHYDSTGGGTNYQCLPLNPDTDRYLAPDGGSILTGAEYVSRHFGPYPDAATFQNIPCARCYSAHSAMMMLPAKRSCPSGWNMEYYGYLMSEASNFNHQGTYECMDINPEYIQGQQHETLGALFHFVKPDCSGEGTIGHCPPYRGDKKLLCVICSK